MRYLQTLLATVLCCISAAASADIASNALSKLLLNIHSMQADFSQTVKDKTTQTTSLGKMSLQRPGKFRWEVLSPNRQLIIASGSRIWIYDRDLQQVTIQTLRGGSGTAPALLLSDQSLQLENDYIVKTVPAKSALAGLQVFELIPKDKDDPLNKIILTFLRQAIHEMQLQDRLGHATIISFKNVQVDKPVNETLFHFTPPANIDVIDETQDPK